MRLLKEQRLKENIALESLGEIVIAEPFSLILLLNVVLKIVRLFVRISKKPP